MLSIRLSFCGTCFPQRLPRRRGRARDRVFHPGRVEGGTPAARVVPRKLEIVTLARHAALDVADATPGGAKRTEHGQVGRRPRRSVTGQPSLLNDLIRTD